MRVLQLSVVAGSCVAVAPRKASTADRQAVQFCQTVGVNVTPKQLERWRQAGWVPGSTVTQLGVGHGTTSKYDSAQLEHIAEAAHRMRKCQPHNSLRVVRHWLFQDQYPIIKPELIREDLLSILGELDLNEDRIDILASEAAQKRSELRTELQAAAKERQSGHHPTRRPAVDPATGNPLTVNEIASSAFGEMANAAIFGESHDVAALAPLFDSKTPGIEFVHDDFAAVLRQINIKELRSTAETIELQRLQRMKAELHVRELEEVELAGVLRDLFISEGRQDEIGLLAPLLIHKFFEIA